ncbi:MAG: RIP metalloprotease RseP [Saccharofermentanales bacterium]|jgi:regulator of sigma E protease
MGIVVGFSILSIMMIVHELGHFLTGLRLGFKIEEFSLFMGPVLFSRTRRGIKYSIKLFPIGASVRFAGEYTDDLVPGDDDPGHFFNRPKWARAIVIGTGPALNFLSGILAFFIMFTSFGYTVPVIAQVNSNTLAYEAGLQAGDRIIAVEGESIRTTLDFGGREMFLTADQPMQLRLRSPDGSIRETTLVPVAVDGYRLGITVDLSGADAGVRISSVDEKSNNGNPVLRVGDILLSVNGVPYGHDDFVQTVEDSAGGPLCVLVKRDGQNLELEMAATQYRYHLSRGIYFESGRALVPAIGQSFLWSWSIIKVTLRSIGMMFTGVVKPQEALSGPVGVVTIISDVISAKQPLADKIYQLLWLFALISVSLGFMNLLPIPPLDGNHLVLIVIEAIRGKRLSEKTQHIIGMAGLALIILLAAAGLLFDVMRLVGR